MKKEKVLNFLMSNKDKKVKEILPELEALLTTSQRQKNFKILPDGRIYQLCYWHKVWELVDEETYGRKKGSPTGFNNMCKEGTSAWAKYQARIKKGKAELLNALLDGQISPEKAKKEMQKLQEPPQPGEPTQVKEFYLQESDIPQ